MNKTCGSCGEAKPLEAFYLNRSRPTGAGKGVGSRCKECHNTDAKRRTAATRAELRLAAIEAYGGKCSCCGEAEEVFLAIDHVDGGGLKHRRELGGSIYRWLRLQGYPPGFQVLCHNCNWAKYRLGRCPHQNR